MTMTAAELRSSLRQVFDKFDADKSGFISTDEMRAVCEAMDVQLTPEQLSAMMVSADPDGSGEIDFEEFVVALKQQMESGGQLAEVVTSAGGFFGFNPWSWFAREPTEETARKQQQPSSGPPKGWLPRFMSHRSPSAAAEQPWQVANVARKGHKSASHPRSSGPARPIVPLMPIYRGNFKEIPGTTAPGYASPRFSSLKSQRAIQAGAEYVEQQRRWEEAEAERIAKEAIRHKLGLPADAHVEIGPDGHVLMEGDGFAQPVPLSEEEVAERAARREEMEASITEAEKSRYREIFDKFDRDGSGAVSTDEMTMMLRE